MKKRLVSLMLILTMIMSVTLGGCGNSDKGNSKSSESSAEESSSSVAQKTSESEVSQEKEPELEEKTIQVLLAGPGVQADSEKVWEAFNEMLQEYVPNTTVEITMIPFAEYRDNFNRMLAAEEAFDLTWVGYAVPLKDHMTNGDLMPLDDLVNEYAQATIEELGGTDVLDIHRHSDGELYYLPSWQGLIGNKRAWYMPTELVKIVEQKYPNWLEETQKAVDVWWNEEMTADNTRKVYEQWDKWFTTLKEADKLYVGIGTGSESNWMNWTYGNCSSPLIAYGSGAGVGVMNWDPDFEVLDLGSSEIAEIRYEYAAKWYKEGVIPSDILSTDSSQYKFVQNGEYNDYTVTLACHNLWAESQKFTYEEKAGVELSFIEIERDGVLTPGSSTAMAIPYCADEPERGMMVLNAIYTVPELYQLLVYGFEGTHYTKNSDGTITHVGLGSADSPYGLMDWYFGTCKNGLASDKGRLTFYTELQESESTAYINPFANFVYDKSAVQDILTALNALSAEYSNTLVYGLAGDDWRDVYEEYQSLREKAGIQKVKEDYQKQLEAYMKENNITSW